MKIKVCYESGSEQYTSLAGVQNVLTFIRAIDIKFQLHIKVSFFNRDEFL